MQQELFGGKGLGGTTRSTAIRIQTVLERKQCRRRRPVPPASTRREVLQGDIQLTADAAKAIVRERIWPTTMDIE